jgi:hypothetical protein
VSVLGFRLLWAAIATAKIKKQYSYLTKEDAKLTEEDDMVAEQLARGVKTGEVDVAQLQKQKKEIDSVIASPQNQMLLQSAQPKMMRDAVPPASMFTMNFSFPQAFGAMSQPASGREGSEALRYRTRRPEFGMHAGGGEPGPSTSIEMDNLMGRYGHPAPYDSSDDDEYV